MMRFNNAIAVAAALATTPLAYGVPTLLLQDSTAQSSLSVSDTAATLDLTLRFNTDGNGVGGLGYILTTDGDVTYATPSAQALVLFSEGEKLFDPDPGMALPALGTTDNEDTETAYFTFGADHAAGDYMVTRHVLNIEDLTPGTYTFTPVATQFTNAAEDEPSAASFAASSFTLTVTGVPEPTSLAVLGLAAVMLTGRRLCPRQRRKCRSETAKCFGTRD